jgi:hypothetical protein
MENFIRGLRVPVLKLPRFTFTSAVGFQSVCPQFP